MQASYSGTAVAEALSEIENYGTEVLGKIENYGTSNIEITPKECFTFDQDTHTITGYDIDLNPDMTKVVIPYEIDGVKVEKIGDSVFYLTYMLTLVIPKSVKYFNNTAFALCSALSTVKINGTPFTLNNQMFSGCSSLDYFEVPNSVTTLEYGVFANCQNLKQVKIPSKVTSIGDSVFQNCPNVELLVEVGSVAETYAKNHNIPVKYYNTDVTKEYVDNALGDIETALGALL